MFTIRKYFGHPENQRRTLWLLPTSPKKTRENRRAIRLRNRKEMDRRNFFELNQLFLSGALKGFKAMMAKDDPLYLWLKLQMRS